MNPPRSATLHMPAQMSFVQSFVLIAFASMAFLFFPLLASAQCTWAFESSTHEDFGSCGVANSCGYLNPGGQPCTSSGAVCTKIYNGAPPNAGCYRVEDDYRCTGFCPAQCTSAANACGQTQTGSCPQSPPANPAGYGSACTSAANSCGTTGSGTIQCDGSCSATTPANPPSLGASCTSAANSCGSTNSGTTQCGGTCSASAPADPGWLGASCTSAANSCSMRSSGSMQCNGTCSASTPSDSLCGSPTPDLTATYLSPTSGTPGSITLTGRATNNGNAASGSFTSYFEVQGDPTLMWTSPAITLAAGAFASVSASRSFVAGTYQVRLCVDGAGTVSESDEGNNCSSPWSTLTVSAPATPTCADLGQVGTYPACSNPPPAPSSCSDTGPVSVSASPNRVQSGVPTLITFTSSASNASDTCTLSGPGIPTQTYTPSSACTFGPTPYNQTLTLTAQSIYTLVCPGGQREQAIVNLVPRYKEF
jgi:hypothetical protein